jgi:hypothetical protein
VCRSRACPARRCQISGGLADPTGPRARTPAQIAHQMDAPGVRGISRVDSHAISARYGAPQAVPCGSGAHRNIRTPMPIGGADPLFGGDRSVDGVRVPPERIDANIAMRTPLLPMIWQFARVEGADCA